MHTQQNSNHVGNIPTRLKLLDTTTLCPNETAKRPLHPLRYSNCPKKRPFAALEQRPDDPTSRFNSQYRLAYSHLGRLQHGAHLRLHDCAPSTHARVQGGHWHIRRAFPSCNFRLQLKISATWTSCPGAHSRARANADLRRWPAARTYLCVR